eukprot:752029-Hanusia_phi.AAC.2
MTERRTSCLKEEEEDLEQEAGEDKKEGQRANLSLSQKISAEILGRFIVAQAAVDNEVADGGSMGWRRGEERRADKELGWVTRRIGVGGRSESGGGEWVGEKGLPPLA